MSPMAWHAIAVAMLPMWVWSGCCFLMITSSLSVWRHALLHRQSLCPASFLSVPSIRRWISVFFPRFKIPNVDVSLSKLYKGLMHNFYLSFYIWQSVGGNAMQQLLRNETEELIYTLMIIWFFQLANNQLKSWPIYLLNLNFYSTMLNISHELIKICYKSSYDESSYDEQSAVMNHPIINRPVMKTSAYWFFYTRPSGSVLIFHNFCSNPEFSLNFA